MEAPGQPCSYILGICARHISILIPTEERSWRERGETCSMVACNSPLSVRRVLLAHLLLVQFTWFAPFVSGATIEENSDYIACIADPSGCTDLCAARLSPSVHLGRCHQPKCGDVDGERGGECSVQIFGQQRPDRNHSD
jgi:hypothetical protein